MGGVYENMKSGGCGAMDEGFFAGVRLNKKF
jgi:hypothetical protein